MPRPEPCPYHPFPPKLNFVLAEDVRQLRREGMSVTKIAEKYGCAKSSISAVLKLHVYAPPEVIAVGLPPFKRAVLRELAEGDGISDEQLAGDLIVRGMDRRIAREVGVKYEEPAEPRQRRRGWGRSSSGVSASGGAVSLANPEKITERICIDPPRR